MTNNTHILIVDDSAAIRQTVMGILVGMDYSHVCVASNGVEALELCHKYPFKIIFLDWNMPEMDGLTFLKKFRGEMKIKNAAVIMLTARGDQKDILVAIENGASDYVTKPVSTETLRKKINQINDWLARQGMLP